jgi:hypothetical protein
MLVEAGMEKINFSGGEPFLHQVKQKYTNVIVTKIVTKVVTNIVTKVLQKLRKI